LTDPHLIATLNDGGVVVIPTDTIYGIVARTTDKQAVERIYRLRGRAPEKPCIILIAEAWQVSDASLWTDIHRQLTEKYWPGALSLVTPTTDKTPEYLHRGTHTLAYRIPDYPDLRKLLSATGPLIAPSANREGDLPATTLAEAQAYFGDTVDGYVDGGSLANHQPSTVVTIQDDKPVILRHGSVILARS
jgi:L-threonylcarbamoyladenylate synthase